MVPRASLWPPSPFFCPAQTAVFIGPGLRDISAPPGTGRAGILALVDALLAEDDDAVSAALSRMAAWGDDLAEQLGSPHLPAGLRLT
ncbi:hypothetical protein HYE82_10160 [Streptomyces sp. BR123]|uniref:hypothetical protein n=1 Tax=Streptomyces sp. BR123 TaxID=2749828 RepID=UPI0015C45962|nr:hypothetical protein [Streptomyces sp. BR123]NXY94749.1 hypothetical protein [Streptomyces sp. BR123]